MIPGQFSYHAPASIPEAVILLSRYGDDAKILSGGQSLIPLMRFRLAQPGHIIDINGIHGLSYVREENGTLHIGDGRVGPEPRRTLRHRPHLVLRPDA